jgi:hypothetical protein
LVRISSVKPIEGYLVELTLSTGEVIERDLSPLLRGPIFESILANEDRFRAVRVEQGTLVWPDGVDLCPDMIVWGDLPPAHSVTFAA